MSDVARFAELQKYRIAVGWVLLAMWLVYLTTLFPIIDEYLVLSLFTLAVSALGLLGAVLALRDRPLWIGVSSVAAVLLIIRYTIYWYDIRTKLLGESPEMTMSAVIGEIAKSGMIIFKHKFSQGDIFGAASTMFNEFVMPSFQIALLIAACVLTVVHRRTEISK